MIAGQLNNFVDGFRLNLLRRQPWRNLLNLRVIPNDNPGDNSDPEPDYDKDHQIRVLGVLFRHHGRTSWMDSFS